MMQTIPLNIVVEDELSELVVRRLVESSGRPFVIGNCYGKYGSGYIKKNIRGFNSAAKGTPWFVLADLNSDTCSPERIRNWLGVNIHRNLIFRIAVREVESWILADRQGFATFLGINKGHIPVDIENESDPKRLLINLTKRSTRRVIRESIAPATGSTAKVGPDYNGRLGSFVTKNWDVSAAASNSNSLQRTIEKLGSFSPKLGHEST